jgi:hypothetical protein
LKSFNLELLIEKNILQEKQDKKSNAANQEEKSDLQKKNNKKSIGNFTFDDIVGIGSPRLASKLMSSYAAKEPKKLMKNLGVNAEDVSGDSDLGVINSALRLAMQNEVFQEAFTDITFSLEEDDDIKGHIAIKPSQALGKHPDLYIAAFVMALKRLGKVSDRISEFPKQEKDKMKRNIIVSDQGWVVISMTNFSARREKPVEKKENAT